MRYTVAFLWILDSVHVAFISHYVYYDLVTNFGNFHSMVSRLPWSFIVLYAQSVDHEQAELVLGVSPVSGIVATVKFFQFQSVLQLVNFSWMLYCGLGSGIAADLWLAISLCYYLKKSRTGFKSTDTKISVLTMLSTDPHVFSPVAFNSMLAMMNARDSLSRDVINRHENNNGIRLGAFQVQSTADTGTDAIMSTNRESSGTVDIVPCPSVCPGLKSGEKVCLGLASGL
ncbi:hypothetical protein EW145_g2333 [Phellinidium pouzarii]|uniref:Uncharacterized protein n=1 Tax=Phellinidium pouzarii TaxID=167371 RepID=A0A4S4LB77_9AGAM|nr:hypothetical protein EW145_g2333 [Phellinidium pouzarii]